MQTLQYKPNALEVTRRLRDLYERRAGDRIFARMHVPSKTLDAFRRQHASGYCELPDLNERIEYWDRLLAENAQVEDDDIPAAYLTEMDQGLYGALVGGEVRFQCDTDIGWISSMVVPLWKDWSQFEELRFDRDDPWFARYVDQLDLFIQRADGKFGISHFILIDALNFAFELVGATETYMGLETEPEIIRKVIDFAYTLNTAVQDCFFDRAVLFDGGTCSNKAIWVPGRVVSESIDPYHMTSVDYFERWGREPVERILSHYDGGVLHIHGNGRHLLEAACSIKGARVIEMGDDKGFPLSIDIADELRGRAGDMPLTVLVDFARFVERLDRHDLPGGVLYEVQNAPDANSANRCMEKVRAYRV